MKIVDCLPLMTQMYLSRTVDSILKDDVPRGDEERLREQDRQNAKELADPDRVHESLREETLLRARRILMEAILDSLLLCPDMACDEDGLFEKVREFEQEVIAAAEDPDAFAYSDDHSIEVYSEVLDVALEDDHVTVDEHRPDRVVRYVGGRTTREPERLDDPRAAFYQHYEQVPHQDSERLYQSQITTCPGFAYSWPTTTSEPLPTAQVRPKPPTKY